MALRKPIPPSSTEGQKPNFSSAMELINAASEALKRAEQRAMAAENNSELLSRHIADQVRMLEDRLSVAEEGTKLADARNAKAERWLRSYHHAIDEGFAGFLPAH